MKNKTKSVLWGLSIALCVTALCLLALLAPPRLIEYILTGIAFFILCCLTVRLLFKKSPRLAHALGCVLAVFACFFLPAALVSMAFILHASRGSRKQTCALLIVLGAGVRGTTPSRILQYRLDVARAYLLEHPDTRCILTGGPGSRASITEAACMYRYLVARGVPGFRLLLEEKATSTQENLLFSREMIPESSSASIGILSSDFHLFRARIMARDLGIEPILIAAPTKKLHLCINYYLREIAGVWYYLIFGG